MPTLDELAIGLKPKQRRCAEAFAADPERNKSAAGRAAGCNPRAAPLYAFRTLALPHVQAYVDALIAKAQSGLVRRTVRKVKSIEAVLEGLHRQAEGEEPTCTKTKRGTRLGALIDEETTEEFNTLNARGKLLDYYDPNNKQPGGNVTNILNVVLRTPAEQLAASYREAFDVDAKVEE